MLKGISVRAFLAVSILCILFYHCQAFGRASNEQDFLEKILKGCAEYCDKLKNSALFFVCKEKIEEEQYSFTEGDFYRTSVREGGNSYIYDYQLIRKGEKITESRTLLEENGKKRLEKNAELKKGVFYSKRSFFGPIGLLDGRYQGFYNYKVIEMEDIFGKKAYVIEAVPKKQTTPIPNYGESLMDTEIPNYGKVWVDSENFSILKIEIDQESLVGFQDVKEKAKEQNIKPVFKITHYYETEKNGIRFPSKTIFLEDYVGFEITKATKSKTTISYSDYKFFVVDWEIKD